MFVISDNANKSLKTVAKIHEGKFDGKTVSYINNDNDDDTIYKCFTDMTLPSGKFQPCPDTSHERDILYMAGPSGSGKSTLVCQYLNNYLKEFPKNPIYVFSKLTEDPSLDKIKGIKRIKIDDRLISQPIDCEDLANSVVIFDDTDCIKNKGHKDALNSLKNSILETGRHTRTSCLITSHLACKGNETRSILNEAHQIYFFIGSGMPINYLLQNYMGLEKKQISELKKDNTRWHGFIRGYPQMVLTETTLRFLKDIC